MCTVHFVNGLSCLSSLCLSAAVSMCRRLYYALFLLSLAYSLLPQFHSLKLIPYHIITYQFFTLSSYYLCGTVVLQALFILSFSYSRSTVSHKKITQQYKTLPSIFVLLYFHSSSTIYFKTLCSYYALFLLSFSYST